MKGPILCFVGPPGVGKTSLGRSHSTRSLGRKFQRISLGGMHDEAELRGHRRTYIGALPGPNHSERCAGPRPTIRSSCLTRSTSLGRDFRGDPSSALLETSRSGTEQHISGQLSRCAVRPVEGALYLHGEHARPDSRAACAIRMEIIDLVGLHRGREDATSLSATSFRGRSRKTAFEPKEGQAPDIEFPEESSRLHRPPLHKGSGGAQAGAADRRPSAANKRRRIAEGKTGEAGRRPRRSFRNSLGGIKVRVDTEIGRAHSSVRRRGCRTWRGHRRAAIYSLSKPTG